MNKFLGLVAVLATTVSLNGSAKAAEDYQELPLEFEHDTTARITAVKLLESKVTTEVDGNFQNRNIEIVIGIKSVASRCETVESIRASGLQSSLESALNPSDYYFRVYTKWKPECATGSYGPPAFSKIRMKFYVDQRDVADADKPWPAPGQFAKMGLVKEFNFDAGMSGGYKRWSLYRLDLLDIDNPKLEFKKTYSYVQGQTVDQ